MLQILIKLILIIFLYFVQFVNNKCLFNIFMLKRASSQKWFDHFFQISFCYLLYPLKTVIILLIINKQILKKCCQFSIEYCGFYFQKKTAITFFILENKFILFQTILPGTVEKNTPVAAHLILTTIKWCKE